MFKLSKLFQLFKLNKPVGCFGCFGFQVAATSYLGFQAFRSCLHHARQHVMEDTCLGVLNARIDARAQVRPLVRRSCVGHHPTLCMSCASHQDCGLGSGDAPSMDSFGEPRTWNFLCMCMWRQIQSWWSMLMIFSSHPTQVSRHISLTSRPRNSISNIFSWLNRECVQPV